MSTKRKIKPHCSHCNSTHLEQVEEGVWHCNVCGKRSIHSRDEWETQWAEWMNLGKFMRDQYIPLDPDKLNQEKSNENSLKESSFKLDDKVDELTPKIMEKNAEHQEPIDEKREEKEIDVKNRDFKESQVDSKKIENFKIKSLYFKNAELIEKRIKGALIKNKNIIFIGPPGTGKSKLATEICLFCCGEEDFIMSTATADWSTFETIGGYQLQENEQIEFLPGLFLQCFHSYWAPNNNKWLIIDEINRTDIDKAFGALFSALTGDNITIPFNSASGRRIQIIAKPNAPIEENQYIIPQDWQIIATMNTFDKSSLYDMSYAFMRRFAFIPVTRPEEISKDLIQTYVKNYWKLEVDEELCTDLADLWNQINEIRPVGPAIIKDMYDFIIDTNDMVSAFIMYVFPQFEGLADEKIVNFCRKLEQLPYIIDIDEELRKFAADFFNINISKFNSDDMLGRGN